MAEIEDIAGAEFDEQLLQQVHSGKLYTSSRLAYKSTTGHVEGTAGCRLGSRGWCIKDVRYAMGGVKNHVLWIIGQRQTSFVRGCSRLGVWWSS